MSGHRASDGDGWWASGSGDTGFEAAAAAPRSGCNFWLRQRARFCGHPTRPGFDVCANHGGCAEPRVPCPADPSHTVAAARLQHHLRTCTAVKLAAARQAQPYCRPDANAGSDGDEPPPGEGDGATAAEAWPSEGVRAAYAAVAADPFARGVARRRLQLAVALGRAGFVALLRKVDAAHAALTAAHPCTPSVLGGADAEDDGELLAFTKSVDPMNPYNAKHARQQASLVANMRVAGLLEGAPRCAYVELGAGKGWLSAWLAGASGARHLVLVDRMRGMTGKADRRLRHTALTRATLDLRDLDAAALLAHHAATTAALAAEAAAAPPCEAAGPDSEAAGQQQRQQEGRVAPLSGPFPWVAYGKHLCGAATDMALRACLTAQAQGQAKLQRPASVGDGAAGQEQQCCVFRGLCIAMCCHHRCSWRTFVGKRELAAFGIAPWEFEVLAYATSWALCGHAAPAGEGGGSGSASEDERDAEEGGAAGAESEKEQQQWQRQPSQQLQPSPSQQPSNPPQELCAAFDPRSVFPSRESRMEFGLRCKQLIDAARSARLAAETPASAQPPRLLRYVPPSVSGESTALLWVL
ncbi:tRNA:m(4)X modification enzyme-like [Raphidocelis subcapitata]|uniref:tRNA:m(4)X modification enzyme TRM13 n=1 Tax=Raphidocelis subcapitata TaxID=307507 RepID=A0A2V0NTZ5_9CHLO|nr:tRNA:m(4)X modification enzyme-like [Raphidocelis subcapitata]|eukprot:GBF89040.1 tRNA:m(4)X modification enzyme-like [Raphidocelis subcapitata]